MVVIEGVGTISVTEPGKHEGTYYEGAEITVYGEVVLFFAYGKHKTAPMNMCLIGWSSPPKVNLSNQ
jgi:hypothetical protein